jgi:hypothetical protein
MARLQLGKITCVNQQDVIGPDLIDVYANGVWVDGPIRVSKNDDKKPARSSYSTTFSSSIEIELKERDGARGGNDDSLGTFPISAKMADTGTQPATFDALDHAYYVLEYTVTS